MPNNRAIGANHALNGKTPHHPAGARCRRDDLGRTPPGDRGAAIAHASADAAALRAGHSPEVRAFLGARAEILSLGIEEEGFGAGAAKNAMTGTGFIQDANDALFAFKTMTPRERKRHFAQFEEVRDKVRMRFMATTAANQQAHAMILDGYNAQPRPR